MAPQVFTLSKLCTLHCFQVNYAIKRFKFTDVRYSSRPMTGLCK